MSSPTARAVAEPRPRCLQPGRLSNLTARPSRASTEVNAGQRRPTRVTRVIARAMTNFHSPWHSPGHLAPLHERAGEVFGTVSKTVVRASVPRVRIPPPPLPWLGRAIFAPQTHAFDARREVSRPQQWRQRTSAHGDDRLRHGIPFPRLDPVGGASTAWVVALLRCKFLPALRARRSAFRFDCATRHSLLRALR
jgi:hypothetical protein